jgi:hypothetical protein
VVLSAAAGLLGVQPPALAVPVLAGSVLPAPSPAAPPSAPSLPVVRRLVADRRAGVSCSVSAPRL